MKIYTCWGNKNAPFTLVEGTLPPVFANGKRIPLTRTLHATFRAVSWKHAEKVYSALRRDI